MSPLLLLIVVFGVGTIIYIFWHSHIERGQFSVSDTFVGDNLAHSLDLKVASKAAYPSSAITVSSDLGIVDGLRDRTFKYSVKADNLTEYGLMVSPQTAMPPGGWPVIVLLHGYVNAPRYNTLAAYLPDMEFYANHGFLVVKPDLRGQGLSIDDGFADSAYYSMSYNTDVLSLVSALRQTGYVDKSNINLWGHSMGGYLALRAGVLSKNIRNIIILSGPVDTLEEMYLTYIPPSDENNPYALATRNEVFSKYGTPADNQAFWYNASPINFVSRITGAVQVYAGMKDNLIPIQFSADLDKALSKAHVRHQYYVYTDGVHSLEAQRSDIYTHSLQMLQAKPASS